ncbi:MAG: hypothetical protein VXZ53_18630, partial [Planctomycetota bacterium]|nr:hypothetical protein [Planctomycetota bacterium]
QITVVRRRAASARKRLGGLGFISCGSGEGAIEGGFRNGRQGDLRQESQAVGHFLQLALSGC